MMTMLMEMDMQAGARDAQLRIRACEGLSARSSDPGARQPRASLIHHRCTRVIALTRRGVPVSCIKPANNHGTTSVRTASQAASGSASDAFARETLRCDSTNIGSLRSTYEAPMAVSQALHVCGFEASTTHPHNATRATRARIHLLGPKIKPDIWAAKRRTPRGDVRSRLLWASAAFMPII